MLENTIELTPSEVTAMIVEACLTPDVDYPDHMGQPGLILGNQGVGKSQAFKAAIAELERITGELWALVDIRAMLYDPVELKGLQAIEPGSDVTKLLKPDWARNLEPNGNYILLFEEVTKALPSTTNALYQVFLDRAVAGHRFGKNWIPFGTGNLASSRGGDLPIPGPFRDRVWTVIAKNDAASWLNWAAGQNIHPTVTSFIRANPDMLDTWDSETDPLCFATPRSIVKLSSFCETSQNVKRWAVPLLGNEAGLKFQSHVDALAELPDPDLIFSDPDNAPLMSNIGTAFYLGASLSYWVTKDKMAALCQYAKRCAHEVAVTMVTEAGRRHPECVETAAYVAFMAEYDPRQS
jgi:hypothetical protein